MASSKRTETRGQRPQPLRVARDSWKVKKPAATVHGDRSQPIIVHVQTPKIIHAGPQEFMAVVQRLTGKAAPSASQSPGKAEFAGAHEVSGEVDGEDAGVGDGIDPLLLTLGFQQTISPSVPSPVSPGLLSPSLFLFSPNTVQYLQEYTALF